LFFLSPHTGVCETLYIMFYKTLGKHTLPNLGKKKVDKKHTPHTKWRIGVVQKFKKR
jgi:hypothetical protein